MELEFEPNVIWFQNPWTIFKARLSLKNKRHLTYKILPKVTVRCIIIHCHFSAAITKMLIPCRHEIIKSYCCPLIYGSAEKLWWSWHSLANWPSLAYMSCGQLVGQLGVANLECSLLRWFVSLPHLSSNKLAWACSHHKNSSKKENGSKQGLWRPRSRAGILILSQYFVSQGKSKSQSRFSRWGNRFHFLIGKAGKSHCKEHVQGGVKTLNNVCNQSATTERSKEKCRPGVITHHLFIHQQILLGPSHSSGENGSQGASFQEFSPGGNKHDTLNCSSNK